MQLSNRNAVHFLGAVAIVLASAPGGFAQPSYAPPNEGSNPYHTISDWGQLPPGRHWGSTAGVAISPQGGVWTYDRCGDNSCADSDLDPILGFDTSGRLLRHFGRGLFVQPHGLSVDKGGDLWVTDAQAKDGKGLQVFKLSPDGRILLTLGMKGVAGTGPEAFSAPTYAIAAPNGDIFVADGHNGCNCASRIVKFSKGGRFMKEFGTKGSGEGELNMPHSLAFDSRGRLFVADRSNNRVAIFDQNGLFITAWKQFGRPSGIFIYKDVLYVTDSESRDEPGYGYNPGCHRGMRIGSILDGKVTAYIPDPMPSGGTSFSEGVAVDHEESVYGAEVGSKDLKKYVK